MLHATQRHAFNAAAHHLERSLNLIASIKTMNWAEFLAWLDLSSLALLTTPGPSEHPHSALLPPGTRRVLQQNPLTAPVTLSD
jgi:hypothetical protein